MRLIASGANASAVARQLGIPRSTVRDWRNKPQIASRHTRESECGVVHDFSVLPPAAYSYVLGLYLGDGNISRTRRVWRLRITLDKKYPPIINRCCYAIGLLMPGQRAGLVQRVGCVDVYLFSRHWPCLFPHTVRAKSMRGRSNSRPGSKHSSTRQPKSSFSASSIPTAAASSPTIAGYAASGTTSQTDPKTFWDCSPPRSTSSISPGPGRADTSSPFTAKRPLRGWMSSSGRRPSRYR